MPVSEKSQGAATTTRHGFLMWIGRRRREGRGSSHGETERDRLQGGGEPPSSVHDVHATILHLLGMDHKAHDLPAQRPGATRLTDVGRHGAYLPLLA